MKYMTFHASCSYAGVANMLEQYGFDTCDRDVAMGMKLPYLFSCENGVYMAGPMLQSADWFNLYLNPIGFEMVEKRIPAENVPEYLMRQKTAMLGLQVDENSKHAVVYIGHRNGKLLFLNNKWEHTDVPEQIALTEAELAAKISTSAMIATLEPITPKSVDLSGRLRNSMEVIQQNLSEIQDLCRREESVGQLRACLNCLFRPLLLDGITMLELLDEHTLAEDFRKIQRQLLDALHQPSNAIIQLGSYLSPGELERLAGRYITLISREIT